MYQQEIKHEQSEYLISPDALAIESESSKRIMIVEHP